MKLPETPSLRLDGKRALVTGASSGIGQACAVALAAAGANVTCAARRADKIEETVAAIRAGGGAATALTFDQTNLGAMADVFSDPFDVVLNSAGLARHGPALETQPDDFDAVVDVNLRSAYFLSVGAAKAMIGAGTGGSIIHISSQMGHVGGIERAVYCATKHGLEGMIKAMAIEWGKAAIRINTICPTFVRTAFTEPTFQNPERLAWILDKIKLPRVAEVADIMGAAVFLASDASAMITGTALKIDGGWTAE